MCIDCQHWKRREAFEADGLVFAPCTLKPDRMVQDKRVAGGRTEQAYRTQSTYECRRYEKAEG